MRAILLPAVALLLVACQSAYYGAAEKVASLKVEFKSIEDDIEVLIGEMHKAIASSDAFIETMQ